MRSPFLSPLLLIAEFLYKGVVLARNQMYDARLLVRRGLPHPVISVGNLTMGGSGKTPIVIHIAQAVSRLGATPVVLSRGYRRTVKSPIILPPQAEVQSPAQLLGDEPALARRYVPSLWLGISENRHAVGMQISQMAPHPVFILDDGFQHRRLKRDIDIVVLDRTQPLIENRIVPAGTLREPISGIRRADVVIINGKGGSAEADPLESLLLGIGREISVFHAVQRIDHLVSFETWQHTGEKGEPFVAAKSAFLAAAIGNPGRFHRDVQALGIEIKGWRFFRDHTRLRREDWLSCAREGRSLNAAAIITTEKDAVKISGVPDFPLLVAIQSTQLAEQDALEQMLKAVMAGDR